MLKRLLAISLCSLFAVPAWAGNVSLFPTSIVAPAGQNRGVDLGKPWENPERFK